MTLVSYSETPLRKMEKGSGNTQYIAMSQRKSVSSSLVNVYTHGDNWRYTQLLACSYTSM